MTLGPDEQAAQACVAAMTAWFIQEDNRQSVDLNYMLDGCQVENVLEFMFGYTISLLEVLAELSGKHPLEFLNTIGTEIQRVIADLDEDTT